MIELPRELEDARIALVHDYLNQPGGAEKVAEVFVSMFPGVPLYTSVYDRDRMPDVWKSVDIRTTFMQRISPRLSVAKALLPLYPTAFESLDLRQYDLVISNTTAFAKGVLTRPETCHICYCHNPTRFLWNYRGYIEYEQLPKGATRVLPWLATAMRSWDYTAAQRVDYFIAGSFNAARRIAKFYRRKSDVLQPPIDVSEFRAMEGPQDYFLVASRLQSYKRIDLAIEACNRLKLPLHVVGDGPDRARLQSLAGPTVRFLGRISDADVKRELACCRALIFPGEEDFGLTPLEAQASGRPVIAYAAGGALETVKEGITGAYFRQLSVDSLAATLESFNGNFDPWVLQAHAKAFDISVFKRRMYALIERRFSEHRTRYLP